MKAKKDPSAITVEQTKDESEERALARIALSPSLHSALTLREYTKACGELDLMSLVEELRHQVGQTIDDDLGRAEAMLTTQAHTLDAIFGNLARRAINAEYLPQFDTYLKLGLRAQSQCRATLETLASIKNPTILMRQTNIAHNQQVNNDLKNQNSQSKLLEKSDGERLDFGKAATPVDADSDVETVGAVNRAENA